MSEFIWEDPPPLRRGKGISGVWIRLLEPLMAQPRRWAMVKECVSENKAAVTAHNIRAGKVRIPPGKWETTARGTKVYARYMGDVE